MPKITLCLVPILLWFQKSIKTHKSGPSFMDCDLMLLASVILFSPNRPTAEVLAVVMGGWGPAQAMGQEEWDRRVLDRSQFVIKAAQSKQKPENENWQTYFWAAIMTKAPSGLWYLGMLNELLAIVIEKLFSSKALCILNSERQMGHLGLSSLTKGPDNFTS